MSNCIDINTIIDKFIYNNCNPDNFNEHYIYYSDSIIDDIKYIIVNNLTESERRIIVLYAEFGNLRELGNVLNCSHTKCAYIIKNIRNKILWKLKY